MMFVDLAAATLVRGGVIAYPTEGVFGLGCLPDDLDAIVRLLRIKHRGVAKGLILIAANATQLEPWVDIPLETIPAVDTRNPTTWIVPPGELAGFAVRGNHEGVAVRLTSHPIARSICDTVGSPIISTSANLSGRPVARNAYILRRQFGSLVDYVVPGNCGPAFGPSEIRNLMTGQVLRQR